jgi:hypothetical protein
MLNVLGQINLKYNSTMRFATVETYLFNYPKWIKPFWAVIAFWQKGMTVRIMTDFDSNKFLRFLHCKELEI